MRILYASNLYPPAIGGSQLHLHCLASTMRAQGNEVSVVTHTCRRRTDWLRLSTIRAESDRHFDYEGIPVWQLGLPLRVRARLLPWALAYYGLMGPAVQGISRQLRQILEKELHTPDVVHATRNGREFLARAALDFARHRQVPFVFTPNHHPRWKGWLYREYDKIYREADALLVLTEAEKATLVDQKGVNEEKVHVTGVGPILSSKYDAQEFRQRFSLPGRFVLYVGQQLRYKGVGALLQAASLVWKKHSDVMFVFIGPKTPYSKQIFSRIKDPRVRNLGEVDLETKTSALAACEFLCLPSSQESFGGVYVEAWSLGKAVIGGRIPPIAALISEGHDGILATQEPAELANAISFLLSSPGESSRMGAAGFRKVQALYTWERIAAKTAAIYERLLGPERKDHQQFR